MEEYSDLGPQELIRGLGLCILIWFISHLWFTKSLTRHLGKLEMLSVWWDLAVMGSRSLWARWWHSASQLRHSVCRSQDSNRVLLPCRMKMACFWCSLFRIEKKNEFTRSEDLYRMPGAGWICLARRPLWNNTCNWSHHFGKLTAVQRPPGVLHWPSWTVVGITVTSLSRLW